MTTRSGSARLSRVLARFYALADAWLSARVVRTSGRLARPWPDLPAMRLPRWIAPIAVAAIAAAFVPGLIGVLGRVASAAMLAPFTLLGFAALHDITRGIAARPAILGAVYAATLILNWVVLLVVTLFGIIDHFFDVSGRIASRRRPANDNS